MSRIRTIKPQFFRHEELQALDTEHPQNRPMLVFAGLFTVADRVGRFEWRPKQIKLDILPFIDFDMAETLEQLQSNGFISKYEVGGKTYGHIPAFLEHQCPNVKEPASRIPAPYKDDASTVPERGEREREEEREVVTALSPIDAARGFLITFGLTGTSLLRDAEQAISLRCQKSGLEPQAACDQIIAEYLAYQSGNPEFKKGPQKWLSTCNQEIAAPKVTKWVEVPQ